MKPRSKVVLVIAGYLVALVIASGVVSLHMAAADGPDRQSASGMFAFGDSLLFLAVFGLAAVPATGAALYFLRPYPTFWRTVSVGACVIAATGVAAIVADLVRRNTQLGPLPGGWSDLSPLRLLLAPLLAVAFVLAMLFAPTRSSRIVFLCAGVIETVVFVWGALLWFHPFG